jgi:hypothetical protein
MVRGERPRGRGVRVRGSGLRGAATTVLVRAPFASQPRKITGNCAGSRKQVLVTGTGTCLDSIPTYPPHRLPRPQSLQSPAVPSPPRDTQTLHHPHHRPARRRFDGSNRACRYPRCSGAGHGRACRSSADLRVAVLDRAFLMQSMFWSACCSSARRSRQR